MNICKINPPKVFVGIIFGVIVVGFCFRHSSIGVMLYNPLQQFFGNQSMNETQNTKYVSVCSGTFNSRRTGNMLFVLAALIYVSKHTGRQPIMPQTFPYGWIDHVFAKDLPRFPNSFVYNQSISKVIHEGKGGPFFAPDFKNLLNIKNLDNVTTILICGYFQSWRYVEEVEKELRDLLKFKNSTLRLVDDFMRKATNDWSNVSTIGLHVRLRDFTTAFHQRNGFAVVDEKYINASLNYVIESFNSSRSFVAFMCSDDINWVKKTVEKLNLTSLHPNLKVVYSNGHDTAFDLCLLSKCNSSIISSGSFSWWSGWLSKATPVVYYSLYPTPKSSLGKNFASKDYYLSKWKGLP